MSNDLDSLNIAEFIMQYEEQRLKIYLSLPLEERLAACEKMLKEYAASYLEVVQELEEVKTKLKIYESAKSFPQKEEEDQKT